MRNNKRPPPYLHPPDNEGLPPVLHLPDLMVLFGASESSVRRWIAEARAGTSRFPLPIDMGRNGSGKGRLFWSKASILAFVNDNQPQVPQPTPTIESATSLTKRHNAALKELDGMGVNFDLVK